MVYVCAMYVCVLSNLCLEQFAVLLLRIKVTSNLEKNWLDTHTHCRFCHYCNFLLFYPPKAFDGHTHYFGGQMDCLLSGEPLGGVSHVHLLSALLFPAALVEERAHL